jgi:uncharacterized membrane protein YjdF
MFFIFITDLLAQHFYWYFSIWYFDMIMHFLSGLWVGLFFTWFFGDKVESKIVIKTVLFVLLVGVLWEVFEFFTKNYMGGDPFDTFDTLSDVFFDLLGAIVAVFYFLKRIMPKSANTV